MHLAEWKNFFQILKVLLRFNRHDNFLNFLEFDFISKCFRLQTTQRLDFGVWGDLQEEILGDEARAMTYTVNLSGGWWSLFRG